MRDQKDSSHQSAGAVNLSSNNIRLCMTKVCIKERFKIANKLALHFNVQVDRSRILKSIKYEEENKSMENLMPKNMQL